MGQFTGSSVSQSKLTDTPASGPLAGQQYSPSLATLQAQFGTGTAADQMDAAAAGTLALAAAAQELDLTSLVGPLGEAVNLKRVRRLRIRIWSKINGQTLVLSPGATSGWTALINTGGTLTLHAATEANPAWIEIVAPNTTGWVTASGNKTLKFDPGSATFNVDYEFFGASV